jgi:hypothetical protein
MNLEELDLKIRAATEAVLCAERLLHTLRREASCDEGEVLNILHV